MNNEFVKMLMDLKNKGVAIYLTDLGYTEFLKLLEESFEENAIHEEAM